MTLDRMLLFKFILSIALARNILKTKQPNAKKYKALSVLVRNDNADFVLLLI